MLRLNPFFPAAVSALLVAALLSSAAAAAAQETDKAVYDPPISTVVDSAGLVRAVAELRLPPVPRNVRPIFYVRFDSTGAGRVREVVALPAGYAEPVAEAIRAHLVPQAPGRPVYTHLRVVAGPGARVDRPELREEKPRLLNQTAFRRDLERVGTFLAERNIGELGATYRAEVRLRVLETGRVDESSVELTRSTGLVAADAELVQAVRTLRFRAATIEGRPVRVWVSQPVLIEIPARRPEPEREAPRERVIRPTR